MNNRTVAVIMSVYKGDYTDYLRQAMDSITFQSYKDFHVYLGVDGPVYDDIKEYLDVIGNQDQITIIRFNKNRGLAYVLNDLLSICFKEGYEFIARMDADDISELDRFEKQITFLDSHNDVDLVGGAINEIDRNGKNRGKITKYPCTPSECRDFFAKRNPVAHPAVMFRRSFFEKAGWMYPTDYIRNEDTRLWHEGYLHGCVIANISDVVLNFRMTDGLFKQRRNGFAFAKSQLELRMMIRKDLSFGLMSVVYAYATFLLMISPACVKKIAYRVLR